MKINLSKNLVFILFFYLNITNAQVIAVDNTQDPNQLLNTFFGSNTCGSFSNIRVSDGSSFGIKSIGYFDNNNSSFPFNNGILLSTGAATSAIGPNDERDLSEGSSTWGGDNDLMQALNIQNTFNATILEFDFIPFTNKIAFDYIFSSEQYLLNPSANQCGFTDGFAFLIKPSDSSIYQNIALVPGTSIPVTVQTVRGSGTICQANNEQYFDAFNDFNHPTTFNGQTKILKAQADVIASKSYHIKLVVADQGNSRYDSAIFLGGGSFQSVIDLGTDRLIANKNPYCQGEKIILDASKFGTNNSYKWFKNGIYTGVVTSTFEIIDNNTTAINEYSVEVLINGTCLSKGKVNIQFTSIPAPLPQSLIECDFDGDGKGSFNLSLLDPILTNQNQDLRVEYFETLNGIAITNKNNYFSSQKNLIARVTNQFGCSKETTIELNFSNNSIADFAYEKCDPDTIKDGFAQFDLFTELTPLILNNQPTGLTVSYFESKADAENKVNQLPNTYTNNTKDQQKLFARIESGIGCFDVIEISLKLNYIDPNITREEKMIICKGDSIIIKAPDNFKSYHWNTGETQNYITIDTPGLYTLVLQNSNDCTSSKTYNIIASAPATDIDAIIQEFSENNSIEITYTDQGGDYAFSIDTVNFQDSPRFTNLFAGEYTITVRDKNGCKPDAIKTIYILDYPKFFTPNNDGFNDQWGIENITTKDTLLSIEIFDRYGKLLKFLKPEQTWDGSYLGNPLPADDYWFVLTFKNNSKVKHNFSIKR